MTESFKIILFYAILAIGVTIKHTTAIAPAISCMQSAEGIWGDPDPNIFYACDTQQNVILQLKCPEGFGFFNGLGFLGCIPFGDWPACQPIDKATDDNNIDEVHFDQQVCSNEHRLEPWPSTNPNKFYICDLSTLTAIQVNCEPGKGFVSAAIDGHDGKIVGCAPWESWRKYMKCTEYY